MEKRKQFSSKYKVPTLNLSGEIEIIPSICLSIFTVLKYFMVFLELNYRLFCAKIGGQTIYSARISTTYSLLLAAYVYA